MTFGLNLAMFDSMALWRFRSKSDPDLIALLGIRMSYFEVLVASFSILLARVGSKTLTVGDGNINL